MKKTFIFIITFFVLYFTASSQNKDSLTLRKIYDHYLTKSLCYSNLEYLTTKIGGRLSGSPQAEQAVQWAKKAMYAAGADTVILQPCMVPHWVRGQEEQCSFNSPKLKSETTLKCTALGSSVDTGPKGINAEVIEVQSFEDLEKLGEKNIKGKIVFYNVFFDQRKIRSGSAYGETVKFRAKGASYAAKYGALGCLVRSMTSVADDEPHTGNMYYDTTLSKIKIPAVALSYKAAEILHETLLKDPKLLLYLETHCQTLPDEPSFNVVGQINGTQKSNEFIIAGGHLDSWDNGQGAHDDGTGVVQCIEILSAFKQLGIKPKHNIRAVAFMNEENGLAGGTAYAKFAKEKNEKHLAALEADAGGYTPRGFLIDTTNGLYNLAVKWESLFHPYLVDRFEPEGGGADLIALEKLGVPCIGFEPDTQRYFDIHHTAADTFDKVNKRELELSGAAIASLLFLIDSYY
ncbi:M20/M25/M40 family metallo-hydrolase [Aurantibacillus circumpalustris]|uniref:M20/M25/M40 family metallo-hydrolase n=1 Tax=Aurantibacillus circumpalustris TaxID=3036359 RepID=UPI00295AA5EF|nr:M20/M25/M40 family metallo-hydrolase [Aurantibacillus circumpalustris]